MNRDFLLPPLGNLLIVDDQPDNLRLLSSALSQRGHVVRCVIDGQMAVQAARVAPPDLILLDIMMAEEDGYSICQRLKADERTATIPVIFLSVLDEVAQKIKAFEVGGVDYITKPFQLREVLARVENQLKITFLQKQLQQKNEQLQQEIQERMEIETALRLSEDKFAKAFHCAPYPIAIARLSDGHQLEMNDRFLAITGYAREELIGHSLPELNFWINPAIYQNFLTALTTVESVKDYEITFRTKFGQICTALIAAELIFVEGEKCIIFVINDTTETQKLQKDLEHSQNFLNSIIEQIPFAIFTKDIQNNFRYVLWNQACEKIFGIPRENAIGRNVYDLHSHEVAERFHAKDREVIRTRQILEIPEEEICSPSRKRTLLHSVKVPIFDDQQQLTHLLCICEDITAQKQVEERLRLLERAIAASNSGITIADVQLPNHPLIYVNPGFERLTGYSAEEVIGQSSHFLIGEKTEKPAIAQLQNAIDNGTPIQIILSQYRKDGSLFWNELSLSPVRNERGILTHFIGIHTDITSLKHSQQALQNSEVLLTSILNSSLDGVMAFKSIRNSQETLLDFECLLMNQAAEKILKKSSALVGHTLLRGLPGIREIGLFESLVQVVETNIPLEKEFYYNQREMVAWFQMVAVKLGDGFAVTFRNITERKQAEQEIKNMNQALQFANNRLNGIIEGITDFIAALDLECKFIAFNQAYQQEFAKIFGIKIEIGMSLIEILAHLPEQQAKVIRTWEKALGGEAFTLIEELGDIAREQHYYEITSSPIKNQNNELIGAANIVRNITNRIAAEEALKQQKGILQTIFDHIPVMVAFYSSDGEILLVNREFEKVLGWSLEAVQSADLMTEFYPNPEKRRQVWDFMLAATGKWQDLRIRTRDHHFLDTSWANIRLSDQTNISIGQDISDRKQAERALQESESRFRLLVNSLPVGIFETDNQGNCLYVNPRWQQMTGLSTDAAMGSGWLNAIHPHERDRVAAGWRDAVLSKTTFVMEYRYKTPQDQVIWVVTSTVMIQDAAGEIRGYLGTVTDISDRKQAEQELRANETAIRTLYKVASAPNLTFERRLQGLLAMGRQRFHLDTGILGRIHEDGFIAIATQLPMASSLTLKAGDIFEVKPSQLCHQTFTSKEPIFWQDESLISIHFSHPSQDDSLSVVPINTYIGTRVMVGRIPYGILCFFSFQKHHDSYKRSNLQLLKLMAQWVGNEVERQQASSALKRQIQRAFLLQQITDEIRGSLDSQKIFHTTATEIGQAFNVNRCVIHTYQNTPTPKVPFVAEYLEPGYHSILGLEVPIVGNPHIQQILAQDRAIASADVDTDPLLHAALPIYRQLNLKSILMIRTSYQNAPNGVIGLHQCDRNRTWTNDEIQLIETVAAQVGIAIAQARLLEQEKERRRELAEQNAALEEAKRGAEAANLAKSQFLSNMSHELRTPLNVILGFAQMLKRDSSLSLEQQEILQIIAESGEHLLGLINDILSLAKIESGRINLCESPFDFYHLLDSLEQMFQLKAKAKGLQLIFTRTPGVPQYLRADENKLRQILINLIGNAVKFTEFGGVALRVREMNSEEMQLKKINENIPFSILTSQFPKYTLIFEIEDTGPGIAADEIHTLFDAFIQTERGQKFPEGTGLGLPISYQFVQLMGGDIVVKSNVGQGTTFQFHVLVTLAEAMDIQTALSHHRVRAIAPNQPNYRILVVEDRPESRQLLVSALISVGFEVREAVNGQEAIAIWETWQPHLIWMDMRMPVMDGFEATQLIKQAPSQHKTAIIALTASVFEEEKAKILAAGCDDFVAKPFREEILFEKMAHYLGVQYIYEASLENNLNSEEISKQNMAKALTPNSLRKLPFEWILELRQAALCADGDLALNLIEKISDSDALLSEALVHLVNNFRFDKILELIENVSDFQGDVSS